MAWELGGGGDNKMAPNPNTEKKSTEYMFDVDTFGVKFALKCK